MGKENQDAFADCHPIVNFIYFVSVIAFGMMSLHPVCLMIAFMGAFAYSVCLGGRNAESTIHDTGHNSYGTDQSGIQSSGSYGIMVFSDRKCIDAGIHTVWTCGSRDACDCALLVCVS